jgi:hypothetical protein
MDQALGLPAEQDKQIKDAVAFIAPAGKVKGVVQAMSETTAAEPLKSGDPL